MRVKPGRNRDLLPDGQDNHSRADHTGVAICVLAKTQGRPYATAVPACPFRRAARLNGLAHGEKG